MRLALAFALASASVALVAACSDSTSADAGACKSAPVDTAADLKTPVVKFKTDVAPIFDTSCGFSSCHGSPSANNGVLLKGTPDEVFAGLVGKQSAKYAKQTYIVAGDPKASFLMRKVDADLCTGTIDCGSGGCGEPMPRSNETLPADTRMKIRRWIAQGAKFD